MQLITKDGLFVLVPGDESERASLEALGTRLEGHVFRLGHAGTGLQLFDLGPEADARNLPINITSRSAPPLDLISNLAFTPFELDGRSYASVEGFWQGLKFEAEEERARTAALHGLAARETGYRVAQPESFLYEGETILAGRPAHWRLMRRACEAKFVQNGPARTVLLGTGERPLQHRTRRDSETIPGVIMADIWMRVRARLRDVE